MTLADRLRHASSDFADGGMPGFITYTNQLRLQAAGALDGLDRMLALALRRLADGVRPQHCSILDLLCEARILIAEGLDPALALDIDPAALPAGSLARQLVQLHDPAARHTMPSLSALKTERLHAADTLTILDRHLAKILQKSDLFNAESMRRALDILVETTRAPMPRRLTHRPAAPVAA